MLLRIGLPLLGLAALAAFCVLWQAPRIESELVRTTNARLAAIGAHAVSVEVDGRDATLFGTVTTEMAEQRLVREIGRVGGVRTVTSALTREDRRVHIATTASAPAPEGGAGTLPPAAAPEQKPALQTPEAQALTDELTGVLQRRRIEFQLGSDELSEEGRRTLAAVAEILERAPTLVVEIGGHTDNSGTEEFNLDLSRRRAQRVATSLVDLDVAQSRLVPLGFGSSRPRSSNRSDSGKAHNRRIEFRVIGEAAR